MTISQDCDGDEFDCGAGISLIVLFFVVFLVNVIFFFKSLHLQKSLSYELVAILIAAIDVKIEKLRFLSNLYRFRGY